MLRARQGRWARSIRLSCSRGRSCLGGVGAVDGEAEHDTSCRVAGEDREGDAADVELGRGDVDHLGDERETADHVERGADALADARVLDDHIGGL